MINLLNMTKYGRHFEVNIFSDLILRKCVNFMKSYQHFIGRNPLRTKYALILH